MENVLSNMRGLRSTYRIFLPIALVALVLLFATISVVGAGYSLNKTVPATVVITPIQEPPPHYSLDITVEPAGSGTFTGDGSFVAGTRPIAATTNAGFKFLNWTTDHGVIADPASPSTTITLSRNTNVVAHFATLVTLYKDADCTTPMPEDYEMDFGSVEEESAPPVMSLWFKATEILPASIHVAQGSGLGSYVLSWTVGQPGAGAGSPTELSLWLPSDLSTGRYDFSFTVTGSGP
jgi:hypothetical protein